MSVYSPTISADVRTLVEMALDCGASIDVVFEADGDIRVNIYPAPPVIENSAVPKQQSEDGQ